MHTCTPPSCKEVALQPGQPCLPARKKCSRCKKKKSRAKFTNNKNKPDGLGRYCKLCHRLHDKAYRARRTQEAKERRWTRERTPAKRLRDRVGRHRRLRGGDLTVPQVRELFKLYGDRCVCCGRHKSRAGTIEIDHVRPEGRNSIGNIQPLCKRWEAAIWLKRQRPQAGIIIAVTLPPERRLLTAPATKLHRYKQSYAYVCSARRLSADL